MIFDYHGIPIHYSLTGKGQTLVLLHGFLESSRIWDRITKEISKQYQVVAIDLLGHGKSGYKAPIHSIEMQADMVYVLLDHLEINDAIFLGHSMGGYIALACLERTPLKVNTLILLNSKTGADSASQKKNRDRALEVLKTQKNNFIALAITNLFSNSSRIRFDATLTDLKKEASGFPIEGIKASIRGMRDRGDRTILLQQFKNPKYILAGVQDVIIPINLSEKEAKETESTLIKLSGSHMSWLENETEIINFLHLIDKK